MIQIAAISGTLKYISFNTNILKAKAAVTTINTIGIIL